MTTHVPMFPDTLLTEVLALRPEIERILASEPGQRNTPCMEDRVQTVLIKVTRHIATYQKHEQGMLPWVACIARNVKRDAMRASKRRVAAFGRESIDPEEIEAVNTCPERLACARALLLEVLPIIEQMPTPLRTVLVLIAFGRLEHEDVAEKLHISVGASKMRLMRAREYLRDRVGSLDDYLSVLAPLPIIAQNTVPRLPRRALTLAGQFVHLWPPFLLGVLVSSQSAVPVVETETSTVIQHGHVSNFVADHVERAPLLILDAKRTPSASQRRNAAPAFIVPKPASAIPTIMVDPHTHAIGGGSSSPGSSR